MPSSLSSLAAESADELARPGVHVAKKLAHLGQACSELGIPYLDGHHRVLELGKHAISFGDRGDGAVDESSDTGRRETLRRGSERAVRQGVPPGEAGMGPFR